ncbi:S1/P1 Nuclease [Brevundimonas sp. LM2]|uniref:S1/P1 Nuclease n=1 Tax=Brevundimonas sp. LM2 TaxID=1938605 RepID=UPI000983FB19|nr:S1/P1 Nuclease [Brevundimonas sp. LM2]AQR61077.1 S1/P1 Nuclease [Brevundimonas sp. LM2]
MKRIALLASAAAVLAFGAGVATQVDAWGATGHRTIGVAAVRALSDELPAFLRTPGAAAEVGELSREPDRSRGAGQPHDRERDTAHFVDLDDAGHVMAAAGPTLDQLPVLKSEYDSALLAAGIKVDDAGYLPYAIMDGYQQLARDFAHWRVLNAAEASEADPGKRAWYREDRLRREALILRDIGYLSHFVGDGAQPHHLSIHYNGWDRNTPNPKGFTTSRQTHAMFEGAFTRRSTRLDAVEAAMPAPALDGFDLRARTAAYLTRTHATVTPFYELEKAGGFADSDPRGTAFATERLAAGAAELRDLIILAWRDAGTQSVGWPVIKVAEVEAGGADPWLAMAGED